MRGTILRTRALGVALALAAAAGCAGLGAPNATAVDVPAFSHRDFDAVLARVVDDEGRVDYAALRADRRDLDRYLAALAETSPDRDPGRFPTPADRLAYWIDAYNASVIGIVLRHWPIASVRDVRPPALLAFLPAGSGFFVFEPVTLGGRETSLWTLEHRVIRRRFAEPRVHFVLNCASAGCPRLPRRAFSAANLDVELERATRRFVAEPRNVTVDPVTRSVFLSSIFHWYEDDFREVEPTLLAYVARYAAPPLAGALAACGDCGVRFVPYDWRLNDRR